MKQFDLMKSNMQACNGKLQTRNCKLKFVRFPVSHEKPDDYDYDDDY